MLQDLLLLCCTANPHRSPGGALGNSSCTICLQRPILWFFYEQFKGLWGVSPPPKGCKMDCKNPPVPFSPRVPASPPRPKHPLRVPLQPAWRVCLDALGTWPMVRVVAALCVDPTHGKDI